MKVRVGCFLVVEVEYFDQQPLQGAFFFVRTTLPLSETDISKKLRSEGQDAGMLEVKGGCEMGIALMG